MWTFLDPWQTHQYSRRNIKITSSFKNEFSAMKLLTNGKIEKNIVFVTQNYCQHGSNIRQTKIPLQEMYPRRDTIQDEMNTLCLKHVNETNKTICIDNFSVEKTLDYDLEESNFVEGELSFDRESMKMEQNKLTRMIPSKEKGQISFNKETDNE